MFFKSKTYRKSYLKSMLFVLPGIILTVAFVIYPVINTAWLSLNKWNGIGGAPVTDDFAHQIGADYYTPDAASAAETARSAVLARKSA